MEKSPVRLPILRASLLVCFALGLANAVGWVFDMPLLVSFFAALPKMVPATTVLLLGSATSLWLQLGAAPRPRLAGLVAAGVCALGVFMLACQLSGRVPAPFQLSGADAQTELSLSAPLTSAMFSLLAAAMALLARNRTIQLAQGAAMAVLLVALLNLASYFLQDTQLDELLPQQGVSAPTTVAAILLSCITLMLRPAQGIMTVITGVSPSARLARRLLLLALAIPVALFASAAAALNTGLSDAETLLPLLAWGSIVLLAVLVWRFAFRLYEVDAARTGAQQALQEALQHLREERDRKDVFLATLAHELRNPLAPIQSAAEMLHHMQQPDKARLAKVGAMIQRQVDQMVHLVDDVMDVSRIGRGQLELDLRPVELQAVIADAYEQVRPAIERKRHACRLDLAPEPVVVTGDHKRLVQVVANLLSNATKYTADGGVLELGLRVAAQEAVVSVRDNGRGIDAGLLPKVFETFTQAALTPDRREGGLGLGLALVKRLAELHGGTVRAESDGVGKGSSFVVVLPLGGTTQADEPVDRA